MIYTLLKRELKLSLRHFREILFASLFFTFCGILFAFALGPAQDTLSQYGAGIIWVLLLFSISLNLPYFFHKDEQDGCLEQLLIHMPNGSLLFLIKAGIQSLIMGICFGFSSLLLCLLFHLSPDLIGWLIGSLLIAAPGFVFIGGMVTGLLLKTTGSSFIRPLILFPFYIPLLIFGLGVSDCILMRQSPLPFFKILCGLSILAQLFSTLMAGKILRSSF